VPPSIRQQIARGLSAAAALVWAMAWGLPAFWSLASGVDLYHQTSAMGEWLQAFAPLRENTWVCLRDIVVAAIPGAALLALGRRGGSGVEAPRAWRPMPLLATLLVIQAVQSAMVTGIVEYDLWTRTTGVLMEAVPAVMAAAALAVLLRRSGPVREWDGGALLSVGTLAVAFVAPLISATGLYWLMFGPRPTAFQTELPLHLLHWPLALGLAALACRWVSTRPGRKPRGAYALAVLAGFVFPVLLTMTLGHLYMLPITLLAMLVVGQHLHAWAERGTPSARMAIQVG
jgi:hypothetical protein